MSKYSIFLSYNSLNVGTARVIQMILQEAFHDKLQCFISKYDIKSGKRWEEEIRSRIENDSALISLVTPKFIESDWFYIEWAGFWYQKKPFYLLLVDHINLDQLVDPMKSIQLTWFSNQDSVQLLFNSLHEVLYGSRVEQLDYYIRFVEKLQQLATDSLRQELLNSYEQYREGNVELPTDLNEVLKIIEYFYEDAEAVSRNLSTLDQATRYEAAQRALREKKYNVMMQFCRVITEQEALYKLGVGLIEQGLADSEYLREICDLLKDKNSVGYKIIVEKLIATNNFTVPIINELIPLFRNGIQLKDIGVVLAGKIDSPIPFVLIINRMIELKKGKMLIYEVLDALKSKNPSILLEVRNQILDTNKSVNKWFNENVE